MTCCPTAPCAPAAPIDVDIDSTDSHAPLAPPAPPIIDCGTGYHARIVIPSFSKAIAAWTGASIEVAQFNYSVGSWFTIRGLPTKPATPTFVPVIRYRIDTQMFRYKLWENAGEVLYLPLYGGQPIGPNFSIELWSVRDKLTLRNQFTESLVLNTAQAGSRCVDSKECSDIWFDLPLTIPFTNPECQLWLNNTAFFGSSDTGFWSSEPVFGKP